MSAYFRNPSGVAAGSNGDVFVADRKSHVIRRIAGGKVTTLAGTPAKYGHASSPAAFVYFNDPLNLTFKPPSTLYVADRGNHRIRIITW